MFREMFADVGPLDWDDLEIVTVVNDKILRRLDEDRQSLRDLVMNATRDTHLGPLCERFDVLDKFVLYDDPAGWRLRLHIFLPGYRDRPHNHRWTFTSRILSGSYLHTVYGTEDLFAVEGSIAELSAGMSRTERPGDSYTLHHCMIHSVVAESYTTSIIVRGPAAKDHMVITDRATGKSWRHYGAFQETEQQKRDKRMTEDHARARIELLTELGVI